MVGCLGNSFAFTKKLLINFLFFIYLLCLISKNADYPHVAFNLKNQGIEIKTKRCIFFNMTLYIQTLDKMYMHNYSDIISGIHSIPPLLSSVELQVAVIPIPAAETLGTLTISANNAKAINIIQKSENMVAQ